MWEVVASSSVKKGPFGGAAKPVKYVAWEMKKLLPYFKQHPEVGAKVKALWATRLSGRLEQQDTEAPRPAAAAPTPSPSGTDASSVSRDDGAPKWADYGFSSNFVYGRYGDLGPLRRALPSNFLRMSLWNFGREYRALRKSFGNGEFQVRVHARARVAM